MTVQSRRNNKVLLIKKSSEAARGHQNATSNVLVCFSLWIHDKQWSAKSNKANQYHRALSTVCWVIVMCSPDIMCFLKHPLQQNTTYLSFFRHLPEKHMSVLSKTSSHVSASAKTSSHKTVSRKTSQGITESPKTPEVSISEYGCALARSHYLPIAPQTQVEPHESLLNHDGMLVFSVSCRDQER